MGLTFQINLTFQHFHTGIIIHNFGIKVKGFTKKFPTPNKIVDKSSRLWYNVLVFGNRTVFSSAKITLQAHALFLVKSAFLFFRKERLL